ncbi:MAG: alpha/beta hydrolase domain-containing protein [Pseudomonadota bacterium]|nr:alpha/beta hydrolase domain-containing protein [Pseudomonadota bacterium]
MRSFIRLQAAVSRSVWLIAAVVLLWASHLSAETVVPIPEITPIPADAGNKQRPFISSILDLADYGYVEQEFRMSGTANYYEKDGVWRSDGIWNTRIEEADKPYATRLLVRRPENPEVFNGIVVVDWFNNTAFMDVDVIWAQSHDELLREGYAYVGVTSQAVGVIALKVWDSARYGDMDLINDGLAYDIFSQAAQAVHHKADVILNGLDVKGVMGVGESQSAIRLSTYVNAFQEQARQSYDSILLYSRFALAAPLKAGISLTSPSRAYIRPDNTVKVLQFATEQDIFMFLFRLVRQEDNEYLRTWELPGASHYDDYGVSFLLPQYQRDIPIFSNVQLGCKNSLNKIPQHYAVNAALSHMSHWITSGVAPPQAPEIPYVNWQVERDEHGNARGGIRLPHLEVPTATHNYANYASLFGPGNFLVNSFACPFLGNTVPFSEAKLKELYPTHEDYVNKFTEAADAALEAGFLLPADYAEAVAEAEAAQIP